MDLGSGPKPKAESDRELTVRPRYRMSAWLLVLAVTYGELVVGCGSVPLRNPIPEELSEEAQIPGIPKSRMWGDAPPPWTKEWFTRSKDELRTQYPGVFGHEHNYLALSGGGANGAFGAGLLVGWTASGTRPEFTAVTGVSTGALMGPFAFLGPAYDAQLREIYTGVSTDDIIETRYWLTGLLSDAMADTARLRRLIAKYITHEVMEALAVEHRKGRIFTVATTNLDAGRPVIWNITRIAASGAPGALDLIHDILLASASIPVAFPPVMIEVEANGRRYDEMHVDGGGASQVYLYPLGLDWGRLLERLEVPGMPNAYLIRNSQLQARFQQVEPRIGAIADRTIGSLIRTQGIGDMYRVYLGTQRDGINYHLAYIPSEFDAKPKEPFDKAYMTKLFDLGYKLAKEGSPWLKAPPGAEVE